MLDSEKRILVHSQSESLKRTPGVRLQVGEEQFTPPLLHLTPPWMVVCGRRLRGVCVWIRID